MLLSDESRRQLRRANVVARGYILAARCAETKEEASEALKDMNGQEILEKRISVDWAFQERPLESKKNK